MAERTIILKNERGIISQEGIAGAAITPGHLVALNSAGNYVVHPTAKGRAAKAFAVEREQENYNGATNHNVDTAYAANDRLFFAVCSPGVEVYALLAASAAAIVKGAYLESAGDGTLRVLTADNTSGPVFGGYPIAVALEAVDNSAGGSPARIRVRVI